jgi:hypothetical protein
MAARSLTGPTPGRPCRCADLKEASNPRIPSKILKGMLNEDVVDDAVAEVAMLWVGR